MLSTVHQNPGVVTINLFDEYAYHGKVFNNKL